MLNSRKNCGKRIRLRRKALIAIMALMLFAGGPLDQSARAGSPEVDARIRALELNNLELRRQIRSLERVIRGQGGGGSLSLSSSNQAAGASGPTSFEFNALKADVEELQDRLDGVSRSGSTLQFDGMNLQVTSGTGATDGPINGLGNIIVGYDEEIFPYLGDGPSSQKTGSHNLVVGKGNNYMGFGGVISGLNNWIQGSYASILGGERNQALGAFSNVTSGSMNQAAGYGSHAAGGQLNAASGAFSTSLGGMQNIVTGDFSNVVGGTQNEGTGNFSAIAAGSLNQASGVGSGISGGLNNLAGGDYSSINGGLDNRSGGIISSVSGGLSNSASGAISHVCGGLMQTASGTVEVKCD